MCVNFLRTGVGVQSIHHLHEIQSTYRQFNDGEKNYAFLTTRRTPIRANDILNGGSVYWIINRQICARQQVVDIQTLQDDEGKNFCRILMNPTIIMTSPTAHRHIQGWRYLTPEKAPSDLHPFDPNEDEIDNINPDFAKELAEAGLL